MIIFIIKLYFFKSLLKKYLNYDCITTQPDSVYLHLDKKKHVWLGLFQNQFRAFGLVDITETENQLGFFVESDKVKSILVDTHTNMYRIYTASSGPIETIFHRAFSFIEIDMVKSTLVDNLDWT